MIEKSTKSKGDITFEVTESNEKKLKALAMYSQVLDLIVGGDEKLSFDGLINSLLDEVTDKRIKGIRAKHGFDDDADVIDILCASDTPKDALASIQMAEKLSYAKMKNKILEQMPVLDGQKSLFGDGK